MADEPTHADAEMTDANGAAEQEESAAVSFNLSGAAPDDGDEVAEDPAARRSRSAALAREGTALSADPAREAEAIALLEEALSIDPDNIAAGEPLAGLLMRAGEWARAAPILQMVLRRLVRERSPADLRPIHLQLAEACERLHDSAGALRWLRVAHQIDPGDRGPIRRMADLHFDRGEPAEAQSYYQMLQVQFGDKLGKPERVDIYHRLGRIKRAAKDKFRARHLWEKALRLDPHHRPTLDALVALDSDEGDWERVLESKKRILETAAPDERFGLWREIGDLHRDRLGDAQGAIAAYVAALELAPDDRETLIALFDLYRGTRQWEKAVATSLRVAELETDRKRACALYQFVAATYRDVLDDPERAVEYYDRALDTDPDDLSSLEATERILADRGNWNGLEHAYLRMLDRIPDAGQAALRETLLGALGRLARDHLADLPRAEGYFRRAAALSPANPAYDAILADLYERMPGRWADAAAQHERLLRLDPKRLESYKGLVRVYHAAGRADEAWCVCAALAFLGRAEPAEAEYYRRYRPKSGPAFRGALDDAAWRHRLAHRDRDRRISDVLAILEPGVRMAVGRSAKALALRKQDRHDPASSNLALARAVRLAAAALGVPAPALYVLPDHPGGLTFAPTEEVALVAGQDILSGFSPAELRFVAARYVAACRPEHQIQYLLAVAAAETGTPIERLLGAYVRAAMRTVVQEASPAIGAAADDHDGIVEAARKALETNLTPAARHLLGPAVERLVDAPVEDLAVWMAGADLTGDRAGLLVCGDLAAAAAALSRSPAVMPDLTPARRTDELIVFSVSDDHFALRRQLGIALTAG